MKKLFVCSGFYAGLLPFAATIVNAMRDDNTYGIFMCSAKCDYRKALVPNGDNYIFLDFPESRFSALAFSLYPAILLKAIQQVCKKHDIEVMHLLTEDSPLAWHINGLKKLAKVYYTVHDLFSHEQVYKNVFKKLMRTFLVTKRVNYLIKHTDNLVTCSEDQYSYMKKWFGRQHIHFHNFPTLVTDVIKSGKKNAPELAGIDRYILFFGQVEQYKGVDILYNAYINDTSGVTKRPLVIAGKGYIYFDRHPGKEENVVFVNRYIEDEEIRQLFQNAFCAVFPYISGTQSGILSLPYYFGVPSLVSDIPFFKQFSIENVTSISFSNDAPDQIMQKIKDLENAGRQKILEAGKEFYERVYDQRALRRQLSAAYSENLKLQSRAVS
ncbi:glycosyltransferase [Mucilaginibacter rubeus]|uniref:Glycosyltransferase n=1 Tax=Mucilaginibacter rubeus TaxID=2027860 RepID=A0AAE6MGJ1_9SPHI|nr:MULTISPECIES: glycosyltransferase [Mucilaginibacter]QEM02523.1 glycosyltransferase [Mucilaginibacter rubeus]QEM15143.1 glycosyltransferase [Mucilaginibacter gossypii]QTE42134.1 glycosyltransferase [Mucilaginibacter rubeus]QTE48735.1 glycosyltransferase [Mucilaginibacter rubeus]QTE53833.1 glycosyltransferase [Mucilaginibacter rubeus]